MYIFPQFDVVLSRHLKNQKALEKVLKYANVPKVTPLFILRAVGKIHDYIFTDCDMVTQGIISDVLYYFLKNNLRSITNYEDDLPDREISSHIPVKEYNDALMDIASSDTNYSTAILRQWSMYVFTLHHNVIGYSKEEKIGLLKSLFSYSIEFIVSWNIYFGAENAIVTDYKDKLDNLPKLHDEIDDLEALARTFGKYSTNESFHNRFPIEKESKRISDLLKSHSYNYRAMGSKGQDPLTIWTNESDFNAFISDIAWSPMFKEYTAATLQHFYTPGLPIEVHMVNFFKMAALIAPELERLNILDKRDHISSFEAFTDSMLHYLFMHIAFLCQYQKSYDFIINGHGITYH